MKQSLMLLLLSSLSSFAGTWYYLESYPWAYDVQGQRWLFMAPTENGLFVTENGTDWWPFGDEPIQVAPDYAPESVGGLRVGYKNPEGLTDGNLYLNQNGTFNLTSPAIISGILVSLNGSGTYSYQKESATEALIVLSINYYQASYNGQNISGTPADIYNAYAISMTTTQRIRLTYHSAKGGIYNATANYFGRSFTESSSAGFYIIE